MTGGGARNQLSKDFRVQILLELSSSGDIKYEDIKNILDYSTENDPPEKIIGMLVGIAGISPKKVEQSLRGTEWQVAASEIESVKKSFDNRMADINDKKKTTVDVAGGWITWPMMVGYNASTAVGEYAYDTIGGQVREDFKNDPIVGEKGFFSQGQQDDRADRTATRNAVRDEIDRLNEGDYLSDYDAKRLRNRTGKYSASDYQFLIDELNQVYEGMDPEDRPQEYGISPLLSMLQNRRGVVEKKATGAQSTTEEDIVTPGEEEVTTIEVNGPDEDGSFTETLDGTPGYVAYGTQEADIARDRPRAQFFSEDFVYDRVTGQRYSVEQWNAIKTDPNARALYEKTKVINPAVQTTLDSLKDRGLPDINLAVSSLDPTNPWETSTFDFKAGDGRGQWLAMSNRERYARLTQMRNEGLISDTQFKNMGGVEAGWSGGTVGSGSYTPGSGGNPLNLTAMGIWESAIGLSAQTQINPIAALSAIGRASRETQGAPRGRGSGRIAPRYSVPASLREIPDYKTLAQESKSIFGQQLGRDLEDWELGLLADELKGKYTEQNKDRIAIHKRAWDEAQAGGTVDVDFSEVEDPRAGLQYDIEETYANELDRQERVEDRANNNRLLMDSISAGRRMV